MAKAKRRSTTSPSSAKTRTERERAPFDRLLATYKNKPRIGGADIPSSGLPRDCIALQIDGDCLAPRARHGQAVIIQRTLPKPGDLAVLWFKGSDRPAVKILRTRVDGLYPHVPGGNCIALIEVEQLNPPKRFYCPVDKIECIGRVHSVTDMAVQS